MNKQELIEQIDELKQRIEVLEKEVKSNKDEEVKKSLRQKPKKGEVYYFLDSAGYVSHTYWTNSEDDLFRFNTGNCFKTEQEAEEYKENLLTKQVLKDLALELNDGAEIDWNDYNQQKFYIAYKGFFINPCSFELGYSLTVQSTRKKILGITYCLNPNFLKIAQQNIGAEKLIKLFKSEL